MKLGSILPLTSWLTAGAILFGSHGCARRAAPEPEPERKQTETERKQTETANAELGKGAAEAEAQAVKAEAKPKTAVPVSAGDPEAGEFTLEEALKGVAGSGNPIADINTDAGKLQCELYSDKAPITVANFIGLARGTRAWLDQGTWVKKPLYDGTVFHRVIKGFMIQGGDPNHNGSGGPGYVIPDEIWDGAHHDTRGQICMANRGPNTNGSQFFIMDGVAKHLDSGYTIFGKCGPEAVIEKLSNTEVRGDQAIKAPVIHSVTIRRSDK